MMYDDDYSSCLRTYATLRVYPGDLDPDEVTRVLGIEPTSTQRLGQVLAPSTRLASLNGWFLSSQDSVDSRDSRRHIDWVLDAVEPHNVGLSTLRELGARMDISCYWLSATGNGGPTISPHQAGRLADAQLDCWWDVYFGEQMDWVLEQALEQA
jgi:hypothetical protein